MTQEQPGLRQVSASCLLFILRACLGLNFQQGSPAKIFHRTAERICYRNKLCCGGILRCTCVYPYMRGCFDVCDCLVLLHGCCRVFSFSARIRTVCLVFSCMRRSRILCLIVGSNSPRALSEFVVAMASRNRSRSPIRGPQRSSVINPMTGQGLLILYHSEGIRNRDKQFFSPIIWRCPNCRKEKLKCYWSNCTETLKDYHPFVWCKHESSNSAGITLVPQFEMDLIVKYIYENGHFQRVPAQEL